MILHDRVERFGKYGIIGIASNAFCFGVFLGLLWLDISPVLASGMVYILGLSISYVANRKWSFRSTGTHAHDLPRFLVSYGIGLVFSMSCIWVLIHWLHPAFAQVITIFATAVVIFICLSIFKFGQGATHHAD